MLSLAVASAFAGPLEHLGAGWRAFEGRDLAAADAAFRKAFEAPEATPEHQAQALDGLVAAAVERGAAAQLAAYFEARRADAPKERQAQLLAALARAYKARDGHFHALLPLLEKEAAASNHYARRTLAELQAASASFERSIRRLESDLNLAALPRAREAAKPGLARDPTWRSARPPEVPAPKRPEYQPQVQPLAAAVRPKLKAAVDPTRLPMPQVPKFSADAPRSVKMPLAYPRPTAARLAVSFLTQTHQKATDLAGQGLVDSAKAEYAALMQLFPDSPQSHQAARYALALFTRDRALAQGGDPLGAYLQWVRAVLAPTGSDYAEHLAFRSMADDADPAVLAREAEEFLKRYPDSKYASRVRLQMAVALDRTGATPRAIAALKPLASPIDEPLRARAAQLLAWLHIFQGEAASARAVLEALSTQEASPEIAADARRTLASMAATPLPKLAIAEALGGGDPDDLFPSRILELADQLFEGGDGERAMDLYELYLRVARESQGFYATRDRIRRIKRTGKADVE